MDQLGNFILHASESPFGTTLGSTPDLEVGIQNAKQIADYVLSPPSLTPEQTRAAERTARNSGLLEHRPRQNDVANEDEIYSYGAVLAVAHFYNQLLLNPATSENLIRMAYQKFVYAVNALTYFVQAPSDRAQRLPGPYKLQRGENWKLDRAWDICVHLLGAMKVWCATQRRIDVGDIPIVHALHYRRSVQWAIDQNSKYGRGRICPKALDLVTREEIPPFIEPYALLRELRYDVESDGDALLNAPEKLHCKCSRQVCLLDNYQHGLDYYHTPDCPDKQQCGFNTPPTGDGDYDGIICTDMPAVNVNFDGQADKTWASTDEKWWVPADRSTLVVTHVWRDGIWGTKERGVRQCVHRKLVQIARQRGCASYWIDCAVIPEEPEARKRLILKINQTFYDAHTVLCWDQGLATSTCNASQVQTLLSLIVSFWHRRAWTLLEGNRCRWGNLQLLQWDKSQDKPAGSFQLFSLKDAIAHVVTGAADAPFWVTSALVELLPYYPAQMSVNATGLLLSGRHATRPSDSEFIWSLLGPDLHIRDVLYDKQRGPYHNTPDQVDTAFISSNAPRRQLQDGSFSWQPGKTKASAWVRTAYGGLKAEVKENRLIGDWLIKTDLDLAQHVDWNSPVEYVEQDVLKALRDGMLKEAQKFALICPILNGDPRPTPKGGHVQGSKKGFYCTRLSMELSRAIVISRAGEKTWRWESIVELKHSVFFVPADAYSEVSGRQDGMKVKLELV